MEQHGVSQGTSAKKQRYTSARLIVVIAGLCAALLISMVLGMSLGAVRTAPADVLAGLLARSGVVWKFRLPRVCIGAIAGAGMAVSGALLQTSLRNPMAAPDTVGITAGGGCAAVVLLLGPGVVRPELLTLVALAGALSGALIVIALSSRGGFGTADSPVRLALTGVAVSVGLGALTKLLLVRAAPEAGAAMTWLKGSLYARTFADMTVTAPVLVLGVCLAMVCAGHLDVLELDDASMYGIGARAALWRLSAVGIAVLCGAAAVAAAGVLGFVGLIVPHATRLLVGWRMRWVVPVSGLGGAVLVVICDAFGRWLWAPTEIPVGALTALVGAPYFIYVLVRFAA